MSPRGKADRLSDEEAERFRQELKSFREIFKLSQRAAAALLGMHEYTWARWEKGATRPFAHVVAGARAQLGQLLEKERVKLAMRASRARGVLESGEEAGSAQQTE